MDRQRESLFERMNEPDSTETPHVSEAIPEDWISQGQRISFALQYPTTIVPLFIAASALMLIVLEQMWPSTLLLWVVLLSGLGTSAVSFVWLYFLKYEEECRKHAQKRAEYEFRERKVREVNGLQHLKETLHAGFAEVRSIEGERALLRLVNEFGHLRSLVEGWPNTSLVSISQIRVLAEQTYRQVLNILSSVLDLLLAIEVTDKAGLEADIKSQAEEIEELVGDETQAERLKIKRAMLSELRKQMERVNLQELRAEEYLLKSSLIEGSLNQTRMELAALKVDSSEGGGNEIAEALQITIDNARGVLDEMRELGF